MLSRDANYDMDQAQNEINNMKIMLDAKVETQVILQLLVEKEIVTREEVADMRAKVRNSSKYKASYDYINRSQNKVDYYKQNPQAHLQDVFKAKMEGRIK